MRLAPFAVVLALAGCASAEGAGDRFVIDTLPSGVVRITSDAPNGWRDSSRAWRLEEVQRYAGEEGTDAALIEPQSLAVDAGGRVYLADRKPAVIKVFGPDGRMIRTIGREGAGPGEFRAAFIAARNDRLVVHDPQQSRTSVFDSSGAYLTSWHSACCYWTRIGIDTTGRVYIPVPNFGDRESGQPSRGQPWARYSLDGATVDTLWIPASRHGDPKTWTIRGGKGKNQFMMVTDVPFTPQQQYTLHPWGGFVIGWTGAYELVRSESGGDSALVVRRSWQPEPIPDSVRKAEVEDRVKGSSPLYGEAVVRSTFRVEDVPTTAPAFAGLDVDLEGNVWVRRMQAGGSRTTWDVFDARGRWLGPVSVAVDFPEWGPKHFGAGEVYAAIEDEEGRPVLVRWRIAR